MIRMSLITRRALLHRTLRVEKLESRIVLNGTPLITEFMASNDSTLADGDGNYTDWIEVHNPTAAPIDLAGWHLTDNASNLNKWTFPASSQSVLDPGEYLVVFASGQATETYVDPAGNLHADYRLSAGGEYLGLTDPTESIVHQYQPEFPPQRTDVSYGIGVTQQDVLVDVGDTADILIPIAAADLPPDWTDASFVPDGNWTSGPTGIGFDLGITGDVVASYDASLGGLGVAPDPVAQGWHADHTGSPPAQQVFDASSDLGLDAWAVIDAGGGGRIEYEFDLTNQEIADGNAQGWTLSSTSRTLAGAFDVLVHRNGVRQFLVWKEINSDGDLEVDLVGDARYTLTTGGTGADAYHDHDLTFDPATGEATFWFDGTPISTWDGSGHSGKQLIWGSGSTSGRGEAHYHQVTYTVGATGDFVPTIETDLAAPMFDVNASAFVRTSFDVVDPADYDTLTLDVQYDDGFLAYLNGTLVASRNAPASPVYNSTATASRDDVDAVAFESVDLSAHVGLLQAGDNVLAIHALNASPGDDDLLLTPRLSASQSTDENFVYFTDPTPGSANGAGFLGFVEQPIASMERGFYDAPFTVNLTTPTADADIYYTIDGSVPGITNGTLYTAPINVATTTPLRTIALRDGFLPSEVDTQTYIFLGDVLLEDGAGLPAPPFPSTSDWDYEMDPSIVNDPRFSTLEQDLQTLPTLSLVMDVEDVWGTNGFLATLEDGQSGERPVSVELIGTDGAGLFQEDAGIRIMGSGSVRRAIGKKSMRLVFRNEFGPARLDYPFFGPDRADEIDTIAIRGNYFDTWTFQSDSGGLGDACCGRSRSMYLRDQFAHESHAAMGAHAIAGSWIHLYINGVYWGLYNPTERPDEEFMQSYFGGSDSDYDVIKTGVELVSGDLVGWNDLFHIARGNGANGSLSNNAAYDELKQYLDIDAFIDYQLLNFYGGNHDWPHNNWYVARNREANGTFRFYEWDAENFLFSVNSNRTGVDNANTPGEIYDLLRQNDEFNLRFADRVQQHMFNGGALTVEKATARFQSIVEAIRPALNAESARWGDELQEPPHNSFDDYDAVVNEKLANYFPVRTGVVLNQLRASGLYSPSTHDPPTFSQHGGIVPPGFQLELTNSEASGTVYFTLDGSDPRQVGGAVAATASSYESAINLSIPIAVKARLLLDGQWSALVEADFQIANAGDFNADGSVDGADLDNWSAGYGLSSGAAGVDGDADADGDVDGFDFLTWQRNFEAAAQPAGEQLYAEAILHSEVVAGESPQPEAFDAVLAGLAFAAFGRSEYAEAVSFDDESFAAEDDAARSRVPDGRRNLYVANDAPAGGKPGPRYHRSQGDLLGEDADSRLVRVHEGLSVRPELRDRGI